LEKNLRLAISQQGIAISQQK